MDKKSILIGALAASLLFVSIGAGINSSEQTTSESSGSIHPTMESVIVAGKGRGHCYRKWCFILCVDKRKRTRYKQINCGLRIKVL